MIFIAALAPFLALARHPFALGFAVAIVLIAVFVGHGLWARRHGRVAGLMIGYPILPLLIVHAEWAWIRLGLGRRSAVSFLDGMFAISDIGAMICLAAWAGCVVIWAGGLGRRDGSDLGWAAKRAVLLLPPAWVVLLAFAIWDPFGAIGHLFRF